MTEYLDKWDGDIIRALRFQDEEICELAADEIERLRAALEGVLKAGVYNDACECMSCEMARAALVQSAATEDSDPPCTCCGGTGVTYQTERRCACQPAAQGDAND